MLLRYEVSNMDVKSVTVLGQKYKITNKIPKDLDEITADMLFGRCDREKGIIFIHEKLDVEHKYRTLFHEMGHAAMYRNGVAFSGAIPLELEEILVETFASMQYEFLRDFLKKASKGSLIEDISCIIKS